MEVLTTDEQVSRVMRVNPRREEANGLIVDKLCIQKMW